MTHYTVAIIVPPREFGSEPDYVDLQMAPYSEDLTVAPYVAYSREQAEKELAESANRLRLIIQRQEPYYDLDKCRAELDRLLATTPGEAYQERLPAFDRFDSLGRPVSMTNPNGKWDWYVIGGRWDGWIHDREFQLETVADNSATVEEALERGKITHAIITPDGVWHERGEMGWWGILRTENEHWDLEARAILKNFPGHRVVILDAHV